MKLEVVYDNKTKREGLIAGWGFSLLLSRNSKKILFDTGADLMVLERNLETLKISPSELDGVFLSHPHCDHVGGLSSVLKNNSDLTVFLTRSFPESLKSKIASYGAEAVLVSDSREIFEGIWTTGELAGFHRGRQLPEQGLVANSSEGPIIISGCAHPGITEIVMESKKVTGKSPYLVAGGFHLLSKQEEKVRSILEELRAESVSKLAPTHCTGEKAISLIKEGFEKNFVKLGAGTEIVV